MPSINFYSPQSGRRIKEDNSIVNTADMLEAIYNALVVNKNAGMQLSGSIVPLAEVKTDTVITAGSYIEVLPTGSRLDYKTLRANLRWSAASSAKVDIQTQAGQTILTTGTVNMITMNSLNASGEGRVDGQYYRVIVSNTGEVDATLRYLQILGVR